MFEAQAVFCSATGKPVLLYHLKGTRSLAILSLAAKPFVVLSQFTCHLADRVTHKQSSPSGCVTFRLIYLNASHCSCPDNYISRYLHLLSISCLAPLPLCCAFRYLSRLSQLPTQATATLALSLIFYSANFLASTVSLSWMASSGLPQPLHFID